MGFDVLSMAEEREAAWDRYCARFPKCAYCGTVLLPDTEVFYDKHHGEYICMECIVDNTEYIEED